MMASNFGILGRGHRTKLSVSIVFQLFSSTMDRSTTVTFIPGKRGALNAVVGGYRYTKNRTYKDNVYYRCVEQPSCVARITLTDGVLSSCLPTHTHHSQEADIAVRRTLEAELSHSPDKRRTEYRLPLLPWSTSLFPHPTHREKTCCCGITPTLTSFGSIDNHLLSRASHLMMDGTFSTLPQLCNIKL